jgi:hypothetical protein
MAGNLSSSDLDNFGHAISTLIQQRYVWLFSHISRAMFLDSMDRSVLPSLPDNYFFSKEDEDAGHDAIPVRYIVDLLPRGVGVFAHADNKSGEPKYDHNFAREITRTGIRGAFLVSIQSYLELFQIENTIKQHAPNQHDIFLFLRQARNIICHADGKMDSNRLRPCEWRGIRIENNGSTLKLSDQKILVLVDDVISILAQMYIQNNRKIDYASLNLGYSIPLIRKLADAQRLEDEQGNGK